MSTFSFLKPKENKNPLESKISKDFLLQNNEVKKYFSEPSYSISIPQKHADSISQKIVSIPSFEQNASFKPFWVAFPEQEQHIIQTDLISRWTLTDKTLIYKRERKQKQFILSQIAKIELHYKRLMFPLLLGGIGGTFSIVASFKGSLNSWIGMGLGAVGLLLFYYGIKGRHQLEIYMKNNAVHTFFIEDKGKNWDTFFKKLNYFWKLNK
ncbi:hypothetical protein Fleli_0524 [Bernardetia litoralis DSM 6794]|uniref:Uncharacterized protein n=1 Tax=Bernardetia litoralis (strain ATCC 23117 / DSM 6794 / NBRC 15988 / NCIMB 1366 / Fx l1 / Sio-4) TaxID=880071 RepID=I4AGB3_BERLS|nr:hypothetical protein [Bernardetia litoralis]AFM02998.1 hypothetical protein Fleli_0524 [Bernardetia litoralis DSM 6794]